MKATTITRKPTGSYLKNLLVIFLLNYFLGRTSSFVAGANKSPNSIHPLSLNYLLERSSILTDHTANTLLSYLSENIIIENVELVFSTVHNGFDLSALYGFTSNELTPTILFFSLIPPYDQFILGAYLSGKVKL